jgi:phosphoribosyl 1,2-cyclic phosphodiesterase
MFILSLQSGSNGNCIYVEGGGVRLLVDAGISGQVACARLAEFGRDIRHVDAILISHDHSDHCRSMGIFHRKFGLPIHISPRTLAAATRRCSQGKLAGVETFLPGDVLRFGELAVETIPTPHDGVEGVAFVLDDGQQRVGVLTDLGHVFRDLSTVVGSLDGLLLESNYDPNMLAHGSYPAFLKRRIQGPRGHLSNGEAAELLATSAGSRLRWVCLAHLSEHNNTPTLAMQTHRAVLGGRLPLQVASRYKATEVLGE